MTYSGIKGAVLAFGLVVSVGACVSGEDQVSEQQGVTPEELGDDQRQWLELMPDSPACIAGGDTLLEKVRHDLDCGECRVVSCGGDVIAHLCVPDCTTQPPIQP